MTVTVTLELRFKPDEVAAGRELMGRVLQDTRAFDGNVRTDVLIDEDDEAHWLIYELWETVEADEAYRIGLVHEVVPLAELESAGAKVVEQLLGNGPAALAETKALALESSFGGMSVDDEAYARLVKMHSAKRQTKEASEGLASFAEKRAAKWQTG